MKAQFPIWALCAFAVFGTRGLSETIDGGTPASRYNIAVVQDGASWYSDDLLSRIEQELAILTTNEFSVSLLREPQFNADWEPGRVEGALNAALQDPRVQAVLVMGVLGTEAAGRPFVPLSKPVLSGFVLDADTIDLHYDELGHSTVSNFSFVVTPLRATHDLEALLKLVPATNVYVTIDAGLLGGLHGLHGVVERFQKRVGATLTFVPVGESAEKGLAAIPYDARAVYCTPAIRMPAAERRKFVEGLNQRHVPTFSMLGRTDVEQGMLAGLCADTMPRIARRVALNLQQILLGESTATLPVYLPADETLTLNSRTAVQIGFKPDFETLLSADLLFEDAFDHGAPLTLEEAMLQAGAKNATLAIRSAAAEGAAADRRRAGSRLAPQLSAQARGYRIDEDRAEASAGFQPESRATAGLSLQQALLDDSAVGQWRASRHLAAQAEWQKESARMDAMAESGRRYLACLSAKTLHAIEKENLKLTRSNLDLARVRQRVGSAGPEAVYRLEAQEARQQSVVIEAEANIGAAEGALSRSLGESQSQHWRLREIAVGDEDYHFLGNRLAPYIDNMEQLDQFRQFSVDEGIRNSPDLKALDEALAAQRLVLGQLRRAGWMPRVSAAASYDWVADEHFAGPSLTEQLSSAGLPLPPPRGPDDEEWMVGLSASLPLFEGGGRAAQVERAAATLAEIAATREDARQQTELGIRTTVWNLQHAQPNIRLSRIAAQRAVQNLDVVREKYAGGSLPLIDLLDAQREALVQKQTAALAVNQFVGALVDYQRAISWFEVDHDDAAQADWIARLRAFLAGRKVLP